MRSSVRVALVIGTTYATSAILLLFGGLVAPAKSQCAPQSQPAVQPNLPYVAVHNPEFIAASAASFLQPGDRLIGVIEGKVAKAYPAAILAQHGLVEDDSPDDPI